MWPKGFLIMGVSGSGKSALGKALARELSWDFFDADDFHSDENIARMSAGIPLTDANRAPWLAALNRQLISTLAESRHPVLACSALKEKYRTRLLEGVKGIPILYLKGNYEEILPRLRTREGHFMKENLLQSQFNTLEEPEEALILDTTAPLVDLVARVLTEFKLQKDG